MRTSLAARGLEFDALVDGPEGAPLVVMLHGFPQTADSWADQIPVLAAAGYRVVAPDQRGYSPGARPSGLAAYRIDELVADAVAIAKTQSDEPFHLVGHDWGGQVSWLIAAVHPDRLLTLSVLSRPHPLAFARARREDSVTGQRSRSKHHLAFQDPETVPKLLAGDARRLRSMYENNAVPLERAKRYLNKLTDPATLEAAVNWYRAAFEYGGLTEAPAGIDSISCPTQYIWGDVDMSVSRHAAEWTADHVSGPYRFDVLPGVNHFASDEVPDQVSRLLLDFISENRGTSNRA